MKEDTIQPSFRPDFLKSILKEYELLIESSPSQHSIEVTGNGKMMEESEGKLTNKRDWGIWPEENTVKRHDIDSIFSQEHGLFSPVPSFKRRSHRHAAFTKSPSPQYVNVSRWFNHIETLLRISCLYFIDFIENLLPLLVKLGLLMWNWSIFFRVLILNHYACSSGVTVEGGGVSVESASFP
ncbi:hypothetical protein OSB04_027635 [Centaurea solstitialis]|uniref:Uncharacterized protein n=1 Tax=Centaurea solstitialis TaxID=347529 RepID=A0AA38W8G8_9ASTR|nr:hypothetical protein OSB04_027635 [Centaurea solstitialis]